MHILDAFRKLMPREAEALDHVGEVIRLHVLNRRAEEPDDALASGRVDVFDVAENHALEGPTPSQLPEAVEVSYGGLDDEPAGLTRFIGRNFVLGILEL